MLRKQSIFGDMIRSAYRHSHIKDIKELGSLVGDQVSYFTCTKVINTDHEPSIEVFIVMAYHLEIPAKEIAAACKASGEDHVFWKLLTAKEA